jgi:hypothetical protein
MSIGMARLLVRTTLDRMGRFDPDGAYELQQAITLLIEDAVGRATDPKGTGVPPTEGVDPVPPGGAGA